MQITKDRWNKLLYLVEGALYVSTNSYLANIKASEIDLIINTLKNNTPFEVVDCLCGEDRNEQ